MSRRVLPAFPFLAGALLCCLALTSPGCMLDDEAAPRPLDYVCEATLRNSLDESGEEIYASSSSGLFAIDPLPRSASCGLESDADIEDYWQRHLKSVIDGDSTTSAAGPWFVCDASCVSEVQGPETPDCPPPLPRDAEHLQDCDLLTSGCLTLEPPPDPVEPDFDSLLHFGDADVGASIGEDWVTIRNDACGETVRVAAEERIRGRDPDDFVFFNNGCPPDDPAGCERDDPDACWHTLGLGESCDLGFVFVPQSHGPRGANTRVSRQYELGVYSIALRGNGVGGLLAAEPPALCLGSLVEPRVECGGADGTAPAVLSLSHVEGPAVEVRSISAGGAFWVGHPATPFTVPEGGSQLVNMIWCNYGGDVDDAGSLEFVTNGANRGDGTLSVSLERIAAGCP